jgi:putative aldouronate transport system permease protein
LGSAAKHLYVQRFEATVLASPAPILLALLLNENSQNVVFKRVVQTISYFAPLSVMGDPLRHLQFSFSLLPSAHQHFSSKAMGGRPIYFLAKEEWFRSVLVNTHIWKSVGWGTIVYLPH